MDIIKASICSIAYDHEEFITECVTSLLNQNTTYAYCIYVSEDCGPDRTYEIINNLQADHPQKVHATRNHQNLGMVENFIQTLNKSNSKYVAICEGDDYWTDQNKLQDQIDLLEAHPEASFCWSHNHDLSDESGEMKESGSDRPDTFDLGYLLREGWFVRTATILFRRSMLPEFPDWFFTSYSSDYILQVLLLSNGPAIKLPRSTAVYRRHSGGISKADWDLTTKRYEEKLELLDRVDEYLNYSHRKDIRKQKDNIRTSIIVNALLRPLSSSTVQKLRLIGRHFNWRQSILLPKWVIHMIRLRLQTSPSTS